MTPLWYFGISNRKKKALKTERAKIDADLSGFILLPRFEDFRGKGWSSEPRYLTEQDEYFILLVCAVIIIFREFYGREIWIRDDARRELFQSTYLEFWNLGILLPI